jgi:hypothetical protein
VTRRRQAGTVLGALWLAVACHQVGAAERIHLFDPKGELSGYALIDPETGRVDYYDVSARRTGWAEIDPSRPADRVNFFTPSGRNAGFAVVNRKGKRVEFFDAADRHSGWGIIEASGRVTRLNLTGRRLPDTAIPFQPQPPD